MAARLGQLEEQIVDLQVVIGTLQSLLKGQGQAAGQGAGQPGGVPLTPAPFTGGGGEERTVQFTCTGELLTIQPEASSLDVLWPLPRNWKRS